MIPLCKISLRKAQTWLCSCPIDKAANNVSFIGNTFYATILLNKFGQEYLQLRKSKKYFLMSIRENIKVLPLSYWIPKMHKSAGGTRFIITNKQCVVS